MTTLGGDKPADLAAAYRLRGVDVIECDGRRSLAVKTSDEEHRLEDEFLARRETRNRTLWQRLTPWRE